MKDVPKKEGSPHVGRQIKTARLQRGLTLQQLSAASNVSLSAISKIENGKTSASFDTLLNLSHGLGITFDALFQHHSTGLSARRAITRPDQVATFETNQYAYEVHAQELSSKRMIPLIMVIKNRGIDHSTTWSHHGGEEWIYVVSGAIELHTAPYAPAALVAGESAYIDSGMPHAFVSTSADDARIISVCLDSSGRPAEVFVSKGALP